MKDQKINNNEQDSLNITYDSIDMGNKDLTAPYRPEFDKATPKFRGMPRDYYPTTPRTIGVGCLMLFPAYIVSGLVMWGCIVWGLNSHISLGWTNFFVFMAYLIIIIIMIYFGSSERQKIERDFINKKIIEQDNDKQKRH